MAEKTNSTPLLKEGEYTVTKVMELAFFDLTGEKAKTKGSSNKSYHIEIQESKSGDGKCQIFTIWGATGAANQTKEWRYYPSPSKAEKDYHSIINSKLKKGYKEVDVAQRNLGSTEAKNITKAVILKNAEDLVKPESTTLDVSTQYLITSLFGLTSTFVTNTLKCPLGQLTNKQIDLGKDLLVQAKDIVNNNKTLNKDLSKQIENITNDFYTAIPHNLGQGSRGQLLDLLLDSSVKIAQKEQDLDDLLDAKSVGVQLVSNDIDDKYKSLNTEFKPIIQDSKEFLWIQEVMEGTKARNHSALGKIKLLNVWKMHRQNELKVFLENTERIAKENKDKVIPEVLSKYLKTWPVEDKDHRELFDKANTLPLWHGTRPSSFVGIIKNGLLIRPAGATLTGSCYGNGIYFGHASKSINYSNIKSSYWAKGTADKTFMFLSHTTLGNTKIATGSYQYSKRNISPFHSVWAKGGQSGVINDEFIVYDPAGPDQSFKLDYIVEFTCSR